MKRKRVPVKIAALLACLVLALGAVGCMATMHPGASLLRRRCSSCHAPRPASQLRGGKLDKVLAAHKGRVKVAPAELKKMRAYLDGEAAGAAMSR